MDEAETGSRGAREGQIASDPWSRKRFMAMVGGAGAASAFSTLLAACGGGEEEPPDAEPTTGSAGGDLGIVQYALTLELLEEDFYDQILESGELKDPKVRKLVEEVYGNEKEHADALRLTVENLGAVPNEAPETDFDAVLAGGEPTIIETAALVENLGAAAYLGQAPRIENPRILEAALSIHTVEARHAARFNELARNGFESGKQLVGSIPDGPFSKPMDMETVLKKVQPFLAS